MTFFGTPDEGGPAHESSVFDCDQDSEVFADVGTAVGSDDSDASIFGLRHSWHEVFLHEP